MASNLSDWVLADYSHVTTSMADSEYSSMCADLFPPVYINLGEEVSEKKIVSTSMSTDSCFEVPRLLRILIEDTTNLEKRTAQMTEDAMKENIEQTLIVLTIHRLIMKVQLQATVKELECIVDKSYKIEEGPLDPETNKKSTAKKCAEDGNSSSCVGSRLQGRTVSCETESSFSTLIDPNSSTLLEKMNRNIEYLMDNLSLRSDGLEDGRLLGSLSLALSTSEKTAETWTNTLRVNLENCNSNQEIGKLSTRENIDSILRKMKQFPLNREIESDGLKIMRAMELSESSCRKIINAGALEYLCEIFNKIGPDQEASAEDIINIFFYISMFPSLAKYLQEDRYVEMFLSITKNPEFKELDIICVDGLCNILVNATDTKWNMKMTRISMEERIRKGMEKWKLGSFPSYRLTTFSGHLTRIKTYTSAIRHFSLWLVAHHTVVGSQRGLSAALKQLSNSQWAIFSKFAKKEKFLCLDVYWNKCCSHDEKIQMREV